MEAQLKELDEELEKAINQLNWTSEGNIRHRLSFPRGLILLVTYYVKIKCVDVYLLTVYTHTHTHTLFVHDISRLGVHPVYP